MNADPWHVPSAGLSRYVEGGSGTTERHSIETHLLSCDHCRAAVSECRGHAAAADRVWLGILDRVEQPRRILRSSRGLLQVLLASPALVAATFGLAAALFVAVGLLSAIGSRAALPLLVALAPLAPPVGALIAFRPAIDPAGALAEATPLAAGRLPFLRAGFSTGVASAAGLAAAMTTPLGWSSVLIWLGPGLALAAVVAAAATWIDPMRLALGAAALWGLAVTAWARGHRGVWTRAALDDLVVGTPVVRWACMATIAAAALVCAARRDARPGWRTV